MHAPRFLVLLTVFFWIGSVSAHADEKLRVVTTLSSYADIVKSVGGDFVDVSSIASPRFDPHFIEARPSDVLKVKRADLFVHSGLDLEAWRDPLLNAAARSELRAGGARQLDLSTGIPLLQVPDHSVSRAEGDIHLFGNPHYWIDPRNGITIARAIGAKLSEIDPAHKSVYEQNAATFVHTVEAKNAEWTDILRPYQNQKLVGFHNGWAYLVTFCGMDMPMFLEPKPGVGPTPQHMAEVMTFVRNEHVGAIVLASYNPRDSADTVAEQTGSKVVVLAQNVGEVPEAATYLDMLDYDIRTLIGALRHE
jgi:ABC-type Zn uptake system ZnuABC Zn-binding protein ZnuA